ncbi:MAG: SpoIID/LytB domain-containing protein [Acidobacteria bacterium]|nr:SpoIID/LytB domain-containing protein [Acidobacteriota bacterium]
MLDQFFRGARKSVAQTCVAVAVLCAWPPRPAQFVGTPHTNATRQTVGAREVDAALQRAALSALGGREGAVVVLDAQTGRVRAAANPRLASEGVFPPGSAVKPFTLLAALRSGLLRADSRLPCRKHFRRADADFTCAHPVFKPPFDAEQALAHSCNFYFARLGERLDREAFKQTLAAHGLDPQLSARPADAPAATRRPGTHANVRHAAPRVAPARWDTSTALGEGGAHGVTPLRLVAAYAALFNGGRLFEPQTAAPESFQPRELARVPLSDDERAALVAGMRGAVRYGTAEASGLAELSLPVFGKTGTATEIGGFRTHGWFVGFAAEAVGDDQTTDSKQTSDDAPPRDRLAPSRVRLGVLVFLRRGQGKQAAAVARGVFAEYARLVSTGTHAGAGSDTDSGAGDTRAGPRGARPDAGASQPPAPTSRPAAPRHDDAGGLLVRVRPARNAGVLALALEEYLFGALAAEASAEDQFAALKAQAVVSRTYALRHLGRHARDGFDFCATTHCQRFLRVTRENARPDFHALLRNALAGTAGETLRDPRGQTAAAYFSASCGGVTANVETLWGDPARLAFERGVRDGACAATPYSRWTDAVPARQLLTALREDPRSDVGSRLTGVRVLRRDRTGRAELVELSGDRRRVLRGWDFKIIVGRTLGWSIIKSSRFEVTRAGDKFVFRGSGFGHGLGLCQHGAHVLARRGADYRQILAHYFPGAGVARASDSPPRETGARPDPARGWMPDAAAPLPATPPPADSPGSAPSAAAVGAARLTLSSENFRATYAARSAANPRREVESALAALEAARADLLRRLAAASLAWPAARRVEINFNETTADFVAATGQPAWAAAATRGRRVELQPLALLRRRGVVAQTLRHELAHVAVDAIARGRAPRWLTEGLAAHFAGRSLSYFLWEVEMRWRMKTGCCRWPRSKPLRS